VHAGVFNAWTEKSLDKLAELVPGRYAKNEVSSGFLPAIDTYVYRSPVSQIYGPFLSSVDAASQNEPVKLTLQREPLGTTAPDEPVETPSQDEPVETTLQVGPPETTAPDEPAEMTLQVGPLEMTLQTEPTETTSQDEPAEDDREAEDASPQ